MEESNGNPSEEGVGIVDIGIGQGARDAQEDRYKVLRPGEQFGKNLAFFAVYNGHGGDSVVKYIERHFHEVLVERVQHQHRRGAFDEAIRKSFREVDQQLRKKRMGETEGSTVSPALVDIGIGAMATADLGDSYAFLGVEKERGEVEVVKLSQKLASKLAEKSSRTIGEPPLLRHYKAMGARFIPTIASQSLGRAWYHSLENKLEICSRYGFEAIELFFEDLEAVANSLPASRTPLPSGTSFSNSTETQERQLVAADYIHELCVDYNLEILCLQPFMHYEGRLDPELHEAAIQDLHFWIKLAQRIGTDLIQIPSSFLPASQCTGDRNKIVADLKQVADIGLQTKPPTRFAYEALAWGTHVDTWDAAWSIVTEVDRPNFGTCLDTFNLAGRIFADPASPSGLTPTAYEDTRKSIAKLRSELPFAMNKVFYVEVCDGERIDTPLIPGHEWYNPNQAARMSWSRNARLFPFESRGYLPALEILEAVCEAGYSGHISFELFSRTANQPEKEVPEQHARRGAVAWRNLVEYMGWSNQKNVGSPNLVIDRRFSISSHAESHSNFSGASPTSQSSSPRL